MATPSLGILSNSCLAIMLHSKILAKDVRGRGGEKHANAKVQSLLAMISIINLLV